MYPDRRITQLEEMRKNTAVRWQVTLFDAIWHVVSRSGDVIFTNCHGRFTLLYLLTSFELHNLTTPKVDIWLLLITSPNPMSTIHSVLEKKENTETRNTFCGTWYLPHNRVYKSIAELVCSNFFRIGITKSEIAYFSLRKRKTVLFLLSVKI